MRIVFIAVKDTIAFLRDRTALLLTIAMPLILILILGLSLNPVFEGNASIPKFEVALVDKDHGFFSDILVREVFQSESIRNMITLVPLDERSARDKTESGSYPASIVIPENFSKDIYEGRSPQIVMISGTSSKLRAGIVKEILDQFQESVSIVMTSAQNSQFNVIPSSELYYKSPEIPMRILSSGKIQLSATEYYSVGMIVMFILFIGMRGSKAILIEREESTLARMISLNITRAEYILGKTLGVFFTGTVQLFILMTLSRILFGIRWGNSPAGIFILSLSVIFATSGLAILISSIARTASAADRLASILVQVMSLVGGSMFPIFTMNNFMDILSRITINRWAIEGYTSLMSGGNLHTVFMPSIVLIIMGAAYMATGLKFLKL
ncbi:ABC transporter permease [Calorimonas adulescens]|uniref:ABC transporter permease n=1 Tax=Calorimonas adulescens TaxID=2606906 RepID=A0A5D8QD50_9THEO|nr:ABC transporter permease [Calorimonas adulescens]TZE81463.1 ABC transporter permease [Calorimonas adulescens]